MGFSNEIPKSSIGGDTLVSLSSGKNDFPRYIHTKLFLIKFLVSMDYRVESQPSRNRDDASLILE